MAVDVARMDLTCPWLQIIVLQKLDHYFAKYSNARCLREKLMESNRSPSPSLFPFHPELSQIDGSLFRAALPSKLTFSIWKAAGLGWPRVEKGRDKSSPLIPRIF